MADEVDVLAGRILSEAKVLGLQLDSIRARDPERGEALFNAIVGALSPASKAPLRLAHSAEDRPRRPGSDEVAENILAFLEDSTEGMSVASIYDFLKGVFPELQKPSLNVKLSRMVDDGRIAKASHGHYAAVDHSRRRMDGRA